MSWPSTWDPDGRVVRIGSTVQRSARILTQHVSSDDFLSYAVAEGVAQVTEPTTVPGDEVGRELPRMQPVYDNPSDRSACFEQMVGDRRVVIPLRVARLCGAALRESS